jgi:FKBP-type peptidyl-prolyl cis-trans isomerase
VWAFAVLLLLSGAACLPAAPPLETAPYAASLGVDISASTAVSGMYIRDLDAGMGAAAVVGSQITMRYTGWTTDGTQFDSNQAAGFQFRLGVGDVIQGWDLGVPETRVDGGVLVAAMKVGGTRQLIIPPALGYGSSGTGPIPGNAILVFNVTMMSTP